MSMKVAHSFHLSTQKSGHTCSNVSGLKKAQVHNTRKFRKATNPNLDLSMSDLNLCLVGTDNLINDVKEIYQQEFSSVLENYNTNKKPSRQIEEYFEHINKSERYSLAEEIIIQFGSKDDIANIDFSKQKNREQITKVYQDYINELNKICPDFKIANARVHFDETTPHMHVVGVPVGRNYKTGMEKQVAKTRVFTKESLRNIQAHMGEFMIKSLNKNISEEYFELYEPKQGRNRNFTTNEYNEYNKQIKRLEEQNITLEQKLKENVEKEKLSEEIIQNQTLELQNINEQLENNQELLEMTAEPVKEKLSLIEKFEIKSKFGDSAKDLQNELFIGQNNVRVLKKYGDTLQKDNEKEERKKQKLEKENKKLEEQIKQKARLEKSQLDKALREIERLKKRLETIEQKTKACIKRLYDLKEKLDEIIKTGKITMKEFDEHIFAFNSDPIEKFEFKVNIEEEVFEFIKNGEDVRKFDVDKSEELVMQIEYQNQIKNQSYKSRGMSR